MKSESEYTRLKRFRAPLAGGVSGLTLHKYGVAQHSLTHAVQ